MRKTGPTTMAPTLPAILAGLFALVGFAALTGCAATPDGAQPIVRYSEVGDCLRPDPASLDGFVPAGCGDDRASVEIVDMVADPGAGPAPVCPPGTDVLVDGEQGPVTNGEIAGVPGIWCLRNLRPPHPGEPGEGGGELVPDDCFAVDGDGTVTETACDGRESRSGGEVPGHRLVAIEKTAGACPTGTDRIELDGSPPRVLCAVEL